MRKIKFYFQQLYRLALSAEKQEKLVWADLKKLHTNSNWRSGIFENDKCIESIFELGEDKLGKFFYMIYDGFYHCRVKIIDGFPIELTTDLFILASHFNNLLNNGVVIINVQSQYVEFHMKRDLLITLLYNGEIYDQLIRHQNISKDIHWAFEKLINENEAPAIIIADLLNKNKERNNE